MSIQVIGKPPFPAAKLEGRMIAKVEHIWHSVRRWAKRNGYHYTSSFGVVEVAPT